MSRRKGGKAKDEASMPFHAVNQVTMVAGVLALNLNPSIGNLSTRLTTEADAWALYRLTSLSFRLFPKATAGAYVATGYIGSDQDTQPSNGSQVVELEASALLSSNQTTPTSWVNVPRRMLLGQFPWYRTVAGAEPVNESTPGYIIVAGTGTESYTLEVRGTITFKQGVDIANTPEAKAALQRLREERRQVVLTRQRAAVVRLLAPPTDTGKMTP